MIGIPLFSFKFAISLAEIVNLAQNQRACDKPAGT
jgi:hypothetical protein